jgi:hypothetical protein
MVSKENTENPEYVKAGYLNNLTKFIYWPQNAFNFSVSPFIIGIFGDQSINSALINTLRDKQIQNREWKVEFYNSVDSINYCHLLFATGIDLSKAKSLISFLINKQILLVADNINGFCEHGGMINLVGTNPNFGYQINLKALNYARLNVSPEFLELATIIE